MYVIIVIIVIIVMINIIINMYIYIYIYIHIHTYIYTYTYKPTIMWYNVVYYDIMSNTLCYILELSKTEPQTTHTFQNGLSIKLQINPFQQLTIQQIHLKQLIIH